MITTTTKPPRAKVDLLDAIDRTDPRQIEIAHMQLRERQKRKAAEATGRKRGAK